MEIIEKTSFDRIYAFQIALTVLKEGSFISAAKRLGVSAPNITREIQKLEDYLGVKIFKRTTRSLSLTAEGKVAIDKARIILNELHDLEDHVQGSKIVHRGSLRITAPTTLGQSILSDIFADYQIDHPYIDIDLRLTDRILDPIEQDIDLSIRTAYQLNDSSLYVKKLGKLPRVIVASPRYISNFKEPRNLESLSKHNCLHYMRGSSPFIWTFSKKGKTSHIHVQGTYKSNNLPSLIRACEMGVGILNIPRYLVEKQIKEGKLKILFKSWHLEGHNIFLLSSKKPSTSKRLSSLIEFIENRLENVVK